MEISKEAYQEALLEIEAMRRQKQKKSGWPDELFNLVEVVLKNPTSRKAGKISSYELAEFLKKKGWWQGSEKALLQAFKRERERREELIKGEK